MSQKVFIIIIAVLSINSIIALMLCWKFVIEYERSITIALTFTLVIITGIYVFYTKDLASTAQKQINIQLQQLRLENRPSVFLSGWGEFKTLDDMSTLQFTIENVGRLPARFGSIDFTIKINGKAIKIESADFAKPSVIFPNQKNIHINLPIPNELHPQIRKNKGFDFTLLLNYYSINDIQKSERYFYSSQYSLRMKESTSKIDEYILLEIDAK